MNVPQKYLDFEIAIEDLGGGQYRASVIDMPLGEGQAGVSNDFVLPFSEQELSRMLAVFSGQLNVTTAERMRQARAFGETLFRAVFAGPVYTVYFSSRDRARTVDGLRVKLQLEDAGALATLPWEFLRDPGVDYLALSRSTPLIRHPRRLVIRPRPVFELPLRVLVMVSSPADMEPVDVQAEWQNLQAATASLQARGLLELELLEDASLRTLQRVLRAGDYHIFHYIGHSAFDPAAGQGMLALEDPLGENNAFLVRGEDLARELSEENTIRLVVLNSCQSAARQATDPFSGIASSIVARGIPAVVAMQYVIGGQAARVFSEELYRSLADGLPVDAAMSEARRAISHTVSGIEWATPVLFMRVADGMLFDLRRRETVAARLRQPVVAAGVAALLLVLLVIVGLVITRDDNNGPTPSDVDLVIDEIEVIPSRPAPGEKTAIIVQVTNLSDRAIGPFMYDFRQDVLDEQPSFSGTLAGLAAGDTATIFIPHNYTWWGAFVSEVRIDVTSLVPETDEFNNIGRSPIVTGDGPLVLTFDMLPDGARIDRSMPLDAGAFAGWGLQVEALPNGDPACEGVVPWVIVEGSTRYLGTGLPDAPGECIDAELALTLAQGAVGGVLAAIDVAQAGDYSLIAFDADGAEIERAEETFVLGEGQLAVTGGFPNRLRIQRAVVTSGAGRPTRITRLELSEPA